MNKFNLSKALAGAKVITRDGREVSELHYFKTAEKTKLHCVIDGDVWCFTDNGEAYSYGESPADLFMAPEKHEVWINVYKTGFTDFTYGTFDTKEEADDAADPKRRLTCFKAEFEL